MTSREATGGESPGDLRSSPPSWRSLPGGVPTLCYSTWVGNTVSTGTLAASLLFGVLTFFFALGSLISVFHAVGLDNSDFALGMPRGSVHAFMALVLIMLFFLMSVFLYLDVAGSTTESTIDGLNETQVAELRDSSTVLAVDPVLDSAGKAVVPPAFNVRVARQEEGTSSQVAQDMARQLITVLGTLIVAISAFYFGSNSVQAARDATATEQIIEKDARRLIGEQITSQVEPRLARTEVGVEKLTTDVRDIQASEGRQ